MRSLAEMEVKEGLFGNEVLAMLFFDDTYRAGLIYAKAREELEETRRSE